MTSPALSPALLAASGFYRDPYPLYAQLRQLGAVTPAADGRWLVCGHAEVSATLRDRRFITTKHDTTALDPAVRGGRFFRVSDAMMLQLDPPAHTRLRALVSKSFTPRFSAEQQARIERAIDELLAPALARGEMEVIGEFACPLPVLVIAELLGVPPADRARFRAWSRELVETNDLVRFKLSAGEIGPALIERANTVADEFCGYLTALADERRARPRDDLLTGLVQTEEEGDRLTRDELLAMCVLLLIAGHETTMNLIGNGLLALLRHPDQMDALRYPSLAAGAVEELLRYDSPVQVTIRQAAEDIPLGGTVVPRGAEAILLLGAANRDPARFDRPDVLDVSRPDVQPISFGGGIHYCLGAPLARLEGRLALHALVSRAPGLALRGDPTGADLEWNENLALRGVKALPITLRVR